MEAHLNKRLFAIGKRGLVRLHYPGHKGRRLGLDGSDLAFLDMTETLGTDDLQAPEDVLARSQKEAASLFKSLDTLYGVGGSTMANYAAISAGTRPGERVLVQRNSHKSVYQGAILAQVDLDTLAPSYSGEWGLMTDLDLAGLEKALAGPAPYRLLVLTSPSYQGVFLPLREIVDLAHSYGTLVLVDEAHGAHLPFSSQAKFSALEAGADLVVHSAHKSLPAITGTALLHRKTGAIGKKRLRKFYKLFMTTSPSYLMLASLESALVHMEEEGAGDLARLEDHVREAREGLKAAGAQVLEAEDLGLAVKDLDFTKLTFRVPGYSGQALLEALYDSGINLEMAEGALVTGVLSSETTREDLQALVGAVSSLPKGDGDWPPSFYAPIPPIRGLGLREAYYSQVRQVPLEEAKGLMAADFVMVYPPGVPLLLPGEVIREGHIELISQAPSLRGASRDRIGVIDGDIRSL